MATGGYTGVWGDDDGRLAVLHKKELVLNETDTENILNAVNIVRDINSVLDGLTSGGGLLSGTGNGLIAAVDQNVKIVAEFPNVTDHVEIERALNNLVNRASQYAFNNKR